MRWFQLAILIICVDFRNIDGSYLEGLVSDVDLVILIFHILQHHHFWQHVSLEGVKIVARWCKCRESSSNYIRCVRTLGLWWFHLVWWVILILMHHIFNNCNDIFKIWVIFLHFLIGIMLVGINRSFSKGGTGYPSLIYWKIEVFCMCYCDGGIVLMTVAE